MLLLPWIFCQSASLTFQLMLKAGFKKSRRRLPGGLASGLTVRLSRLLAAWCLSLQWRWGMKVVHWCWWNIARMLSSCWRFCKGPPQALVTLPPWPLTWITQRKRLVSYHFIFMSWSKSQSHSRVLDVDALTTLVLLTSWQHSTVKVTRFTSSTDFHFLLDIALNKNVTVWGSYTYNAFWVVPSTNLDTGCSIFSESHNQDLPTWPKSYPLTRPQPIQPHTPLSKIGMVFFVAFIQH